MGWNAKQIERNGHEPIISDDIFITLQNIELAPPTLLVNIDWFHQILELPECQWPKVWNLYVHSCQAWNLYLEAKDIGRAEEFLFIKEKILGTCTFPAATAEAHCFIKTIK